MSNSNNERDRHYYRRFMQGDKSGLEELVKLYNDNLIFFLNGFVNNFETSEDLASDTFCELLSRNSFYIEKYSFKTWLFQIGRNNAIDYLRRQSKLLKISVADNVYELSDKTILEDQILKEEQKVLVHKALQNIHKDYRDTLHLLYFEEMSYAEVGIILRKSQRQVKNLTYRGKQSLKKVLEKEGFRYEKL